MTGYKAISDEELDRILADHWRWLESKKKEGMQADLRKCDLSDNKLKDALDRLLHDDRVKSWRIKLDCALLQEAFLFLAHLEGANFMGAHLEGAIFAGARLEEAIFVGARLEGAKFMGARLEGAVFTGAHLEKANFMEARLEGVRLIGANISGADITGANIKGAYLSGIIYDKTEKCKGARVAECFGGEGFVRFANDQAWLADYKSSRKGFWQKSWKILWGWSCDYGRSFRRWALLSSLLAVFFGCLFYFLGPEAFKVQYLPHDAWFERLGCMIYYSVVTFTTLGFGDVVPKTFFAAALVMAEVIIGYIMLGGLISILANKLARRS